MSVLSPSERLAIHHLVWIWYQYGKGCTDEQGVVHLPHQCMQAGEQAGDFLAARGLGVDNCWEIELTAAGMDLFNNPPPADEPSDGDLTLTEALQIIKSDHLEKCLSPIGFGDIPTYPDHLTKRQMRAIDLVNFANSITYQGY